MPKRAVDVTHLDKDIPGTRTCTIWYSSTGAGAGASASAGTGIGAAGADTSEDDADLIAS